MVIVNDLNTLKNSYQNIIIYAQ